MGIALKGEDLGQMDDGLGLRGERCIASHLPHARFPAGCVAQFSDPPLPPGWDRVGMIGVGGRGVRGWDFRVRGILPLRAELPKALFPCGGCFFLLDIVVPPVWVQS